MKLLDLNFEKYIKDSSSYESLKKLKLPDKSIEEFKKLDLQPIYEKELNFSHSSYTSMEAFKYLKKDGFYYIFITNSTFLPQHSSIDQNIKMSTTKKSKDNINNAFYYLTKSFLESYNELHITKSLDKPLLIVNVSNYSNSFIPLSLDINIANNSTAHIVELFISQNSDECLFNINRSLNIGENSTINYTSSYEFGLEDTVILNHNANFHKNSNLNMVTLDYNTKQKINLWNYDLNHENITLNINGITNITDTKQCSNIANISHNKANTTSNVKFKHILNDTSSAVFDVKSIINKEANNAKVFQSSQTTLLSDNAKVNAQPRLQIYTDELEAKHSATTGAINQEQLYYLQSRGITHADAVNILLESFEAEIFEKIENEDIQTFIKDLNLSRRGENNE